MKTHPLPTLTEAEQEALNKLRGDDWTIEYGPYSRCWRLKKGVWETSLYPSVAAACTAAETLQAGARATLERREGERAGLKKYLEVGR